MRIKKSVTRVTVRHHEACRVTPNSYPEWRNFNSHRTIIIDSFFLYTRPSTIVFKLESALFYQFYAEISIFSIKKCSVRLLSTKSWSHARGRLTLPCIRRKYPERVKIAENRVGYARNSFLSYPRFDPSVSSFKPETPKDSDLRDCRLILVKSSTKAHDRKWPIKFYVRSGSR